MATNSRYNFTISFASEGWEAVGRNMDVINKALEKTNAEIKTQRDVINANTGAIGRSVTIQGNSLLELESISSKVTQGMRRDFEDQRKAAEEAYVKINVAREKFLYEQEAAEQRRRHKKLPIEPDWKKVEEEKRDAYFKSAEAKKDAERISETQISNQTIKITQDRNAEVYRLNKQREDQLRNHLNIIKQAELYGSGSLQELKARESATLQKIEENKYKKLLELAEKYRRDQISQVDMRKEVERINVQAATRVQKAQQPVTQYLVDKSRSDAQTEQDKLLNAELEKNQKTRQAILLKELANERAIFLASDDKLKSVILTANGNIEKILASRNLIFARYNEQLVKGQINPQEYNRLTSALDSVVKTQIAAINNHVNAVKQEQELIQKAYKDTTSVAMQDMKYRMAMEEAIALHGANSLQAIKVKEADDIIRIERQLQETLLGIRAQAQAGKLNASQVQTAVTGAFQSASSDKSAAINPRLTYIQEEAAAKASADNIKKIGEDQLAELRRQQELARSIKVYGANSAEAILQAATNKEKAIYREYGDTIATIEKQVKDKIITEAEAKVKANNAYIASLNKVKQLENELPDAVTRRGGQIRTLGEHFSNLAKHIAEVYVGWQIMNTVTGKFSEAVHSIIPVGIALDSVKSSLESTIGSSAGAESAIAALSKEANRTGLEIGSLRTNFAQFQASTSLAGASLESTWKMFQNINTVSTALHKTTDETNHIFLAMAQIFNKSKVQSEELVKQLGNLLPGAFASFAASIKNADGTIGISTEELTRRMKEGLVSAQQTMEGFTEFMAKRFAGSFAIASQMLNADIGRMKTEFTVLGEEIYALSNGALKEFVKGMADTTHSFRVFITEGNSFTNTLYIIKDALIAVAMAGAVLLATKIGALAAAATGATTEMSLLAKAMTFISNPTVIIAGLTAITQGVLDYIHSTQEATKSTNALITEYRKLKEAKEAPPDIKLSLDIENDAKVKQYFEQQVKVAREIKDAKNDFITTIFRSNKDIDDINNNIKVLREFDSTLKQISDTERVAGIDKEHFLAIKAAEFKLLTQLHSQEKENVKLKLESKKAEEAATEAKNRFGSDPRKMLKPSEIQEGEINQLSLKIAKEKEAGNLRQVEIDENKLRLLSYQRAEKVIRETYEAQINKNKEVIASILERKEAGKADITDEEEYQERLKERADIETKIRGEIAKEEAKFISERDAAKKKQQSEGINLLNAQARTQQEEIKRNTDLQIKELENNLRLLEKQHSNKNISDTSYFSKARDITAQIATLEERRYANLTRIQSAKEKEYQTLSATADKAKEVNALSKEQLFNAIKLQESGGGKYLHNYTGGGQGAHGSMQVRLPAWKDVTGTGAEEFKKAIQSNDLAKLEQVGQQYFLMQLKRYDGNVRKALQAYYAGHATDTANWYADSVLGKLGFANSNKFKIEGENLLNEQLALQDGLTGAKEKYNAKMEQLAEAELVAAREYVSLKEGIHAQYLESEGRHAEAEIAQLEKDFKIKENLLKQNVQTDPQAQVILSELNKLKSNKVAGVQLKELDTKYATAKTLEQEAERRIELDRKANVINEFEMQNKLFLLRQDYIAKTRELLGLEANLVVTAEQQAALEAKKKELQAINTDKIGSMRSFLQADTGQFDFVKNFLQTSVNNEQDFKQQNAVADNNYTDSLAQGNDPVEALRKQNEAKAATEKEYTQATAKNYANMFAGIFSVGSEMFMQLTEAEIKMHGRSSQEAKKAFMLFKAMKIAEAVASTAAGVVNALATGGPTWVGIALAAVVAAMGAMQVAKIASMQMPAAHGGLDNVPSEQTYLLQKGERVVSPKQNVQLSKMVENYNMTMNNEKQYGNNLTNSGGNVRIINAIDPSVTHEHMGSVEGERVIMNIVRRNQG